MQTRTDRIRLVLSIFALAAPRGAHPTLPDLADASMVPCDVLHRFLASPPTHPLDLERVPGRSQALALAAAYLLCLDGDLLWAWIRTGNGGLEPALQKRLYDLQNCTRCLQFPRMNNHSLCVACARKLRSPAKQRWIEQVEALLDSAPPDIRLAWHRLRRTGVPMTFARLAQQLQCPLDEFRLRWALAGLPRGRSGRPRRAPRIPDLGLGSEIDSAQRSGAPCIDLPAPPA